MVKSNVFERWRIKFLGASLWKESNLKDVYYILSNFQVVDSNVFERWRIKFPGSSLWKEANLKNVSYTLSNFQIGYWWRPLYLKLQWHATQAIAKTQIRIYLYKNIYLQEHLLEHIITRMHIRIYMYKNTYYSITKYTFTGFSLGKLKLDEYHQTIYDWMGYCQANTCKFIHDVPRNWNTPSDFPETSSLLVERMLNKPSPRSMHYFSRLHTIAISSTAKLGQEGLCKILS